MLYTERYVAYLVGSARKCLFKIEGDDNHLGSCFVYTIGEDKLLLICEVRSVLFKNVGKPPSKFDFRNEFEEWSVEIAPKAHFEIAVEGFDKNISTLLHCKVVHRVESCNKIGAVVVEPLTRDFEVERQGYVGGFDVLVLLDTIELVQKRNFFCAEMYRWDEAER